MIDLTRISAIFANGFLVGEASLAVNVFHFASLQHALLFNG